MTKKKLLVIHPSLAPYRVDFFNSLYEYYDAKFFFFNTNLLNQTFDQDKLKNTIKFNCNYLNKGFNLPGRSFRFGIWKILNRERPDIVICPEYNLINIVVILNRFLFRRKFKIYSMCDDNISVAKNASFFKNASRTIQLRLLDGIILTHAEIVEWYRLRLNPRTKLLIFPIIRKENIFRNQLESSLSIAEDYRDTYGLHGKKVILFVGRLTAVKNLELLVDAFSTVFNNQRDAVLIIVGSGPMEDKINDKVIQYGLRSAVVLPGRFEGRELLAWYHLAKLFILPSINELFGAVVNEALLAGCYVLVSNLAGGASLIKEGCNGETFNPYDLNEMAVIIENNLKKDELFGYQRMLRKSRVLFPYKNAFNSLIQELN